MRVSGQGESEDLFRLLPCEAQRSEAESRAAAGPGLNKPRAGFWFGRLGKWFHIKGFFSSLFFGGRLRPQALA